jgi:vesicle coat complex subunit
LKSELHSKNKEKKKEAIKKVIAAMTVGKDVLELYPDIVNCLQVCYYIDAFLFTLFLVDIQY